MKIRVMSYLFVKSEFLFFVCFVINMLRAKIKNGFNNLPKIAVSKVRWLDE